MGPFDYLFSFYGLLLGIAVANVAIGFADMWRDCERIRVGTCPPLVASSVLLGGMNVWLQMWHTRPYVTVDGIQMLTAAAVSLPYVFVSRAIFPGMEDDAERSLEEHYLRHRKLILVNPSERIQKLLKLAKLDAVFKIYNTEEEAVSAESGAPARA